MKEVTWDNKPEKYDITDHFSQNKSKEELISEFNTMLSEDKNDDPPSRQISGSKPVFDPSVEAAIFMRGKHLIFHHEQLKQYHKGIYKAYSDRYFLDKITKQLKVFNSRQAKAKETLEVIKNSLDDPVLQEKINSDPNIINCKNGLFDLQTMELKPHAPDYISTHQINAEFDMSSDYSRFEQFLAEVFINDEGKPDLELISVVQEFMGYCLYSSIPFHKALLFYGDGSNGKSVLIEVIEYLLKGHTSNVHFEVIGKDLFSTADLSDSLLNISAEIGTNAYFKDGVVKQLIAGDCIRAQRKNQPAFDFNPTAKHILTANSLPQSADKSFAFFRRFMVIPFHQRFLSQNEIDQLNEDLKHKIKPENPYLVEELKEEINGIFLFALVGLERLLNNRGFTQSAQINKLAETFKIRSSSVETFLKDETEFQSDSTVLFSELYAKYIQFCNHYHIPLLTKRKFSVELQNLGEIIEKGTGNKTYLKGRILKDETY